jgi:diguanylate cyclase (GGDEF)-like protein/PAS domain S-box-containing protein
LLALPLSSGRGLPLVLACVRETASELSLLHTISEATHQGILALAPIRNEGGEIVDFQIVAVNDSAAALMRRRRAELLWARASQLKVGMRSLGLFERLEIVLREGRRDEFDLCYEMLDKSELHLRVSAAPIDDLIAISLADVTELKTREASFRLLFEANPVPMWLVDPDTLRFVGVNGAAISYYGFTRQQFLEMTSLDIRPAEDHAALVDVIGSMGQSQDGGRVWRHLKADRSEVTVISYARGLTFEGRAAILVANIDVTERDRAEAELRRTRAFLDAVVESVPAMLFVKNADDHRYILFNAAGESMLGMRREEVIGRTVHDLHGKQHADAMLAADLEVLESRKSQIVTDELVQTRHNGVRTMRIKKIAVPDESGRPKYLLGIAEDITEQCEAEARIAHMAHHDALTDLPNRILFRERMNDAFANLRRYGSEFALLCLDLDEFKAVNDSLGHSVGDLLLNEVSTRLKGCLGPADVVARLGGDEFAVLRPGVESPDHASDLAERIVTALCQPYHHGGQEIVIGASVGIAMAPHDADDSETLLRNADLALYRAKGDGRGTFRFFEPGMNARLQTRRALERDLRAAFSNGDFALFYQPIIDLRSNRVSGVEALLRWPHKTRGLVSPADFIPLAEDIGLITQIGEWVLRQACMQAALWPSAIKVAVNLSPVQFRSRNLVQTVILALASSGLPASRLELEITESVLLADNAANSRRCINCEISA